MQLYHNDNDPDIQAVNRMLELIRASTNSTSSELTTQPTPQPSSAPPISNSLSQYLRYHDLMNKLAEGSLRRADEIRQPRNVDYSEDDLYEESYEVSFDDAYVYDEEEETDVVHGIERLPVSNRTNQNNQTMNVAPKVVAELDAAVIETLSTEEKMSLIKQLQASVEKDIELFKIRKELDEKADQIKDLFS